MTEYSSDMLSTNNFTVINLNDCNNFNNKQLDNQNNLIKLFFMISIMIIMLPLMLFITIIVLILLPVCLLIYLQYNLSLYLFNLSLSFIENLKT
jgi:hypothetical protein